MATLFNTKISATYEGLLKTVDNAVLNATLKELSDGSGNLSGLFLNTAGDFKVSNILEWGSLKDTGTGVTITRYVTSTDGIENFDNNTSLPTSAAVKLYVDSKFATSDTLQEVLSFGNTTGGNDIVVSASDDITFTDSSKIIMGASSDLQIYHDGSASYISENGAGDLRISTNGAQVAIQNSLSENMGRFIVNDAVILYYDNAQKFITTTTGVTITGRLSGLTDPTLAQDAATKSYVDALDAGSDLDFKGDNGTAGDVNLNTQRLDILGTANQITTVSSGQSLTIGMPTNITISGIVNATTFNGNVIGNVTGDLTGTASLIDVSNTATNQNQYLLQSGGTSGSQTVFADSNLYFNPVTNLLTVNGSGSFTGDLNVTGNITGSGGSFLPLMGGTMIGQTFHNDNVKSIYGSLGDGLEIFHDSSNSYIRDTGSGNLYLDSSNLFVRVNINEFAIKAFANSKVELYHDNSKKFETASTGISVTGNGAFSGDVDAAGIVKVGSANSEFSEGHLKFNFNGGAFIDQATVTQSLFFRVSDANSLDTVALTISRNADASFGRDVTIAGDLTVNGTTTTVNSQTLAVVDPLIQLAKDNTANSLDIGLYGDYNDGTDRFLGLFSDASDSNKFKLFKGTTVEPTTTVDIGGAGYVAADLVVAGLEAATISNVTTLNLPNTSYQITGGTATGDLRFVAPRFRFYEDTISGSPIFQLDGGNATFAGDINLDDDLNFNTNGFADISNTGTGSIRLKPTSQTTALTLTGTSSIFAGDVTIDSSTATLNIKGSNTGASLINFSDAADGNVGRIYYDHQNNFMQFKTNDTEKLRIDSSGVLQLNQATSKIVGGGDTTGRMIIANSDTSAYITLYGSAYSGSSALAENIQVIQNSAVTATFSEENRLGVGISEPAYKLHVHNPSTVFGQTAEIALGVKSNDNNDNPRVVFQAIKSGTNMGSLAIQTLTSNTLTEKLRIDASGNVQLQTVGSQLRFQNSAGAAPYIKNSGENSSTAPYGQNLEFYTGGSKRLTIESSGNSTFAGTVTFNDHTIHPDQVKSKFGTDSDASIEHNGSHLFIDNSTGTTYLRNTSTGDILLRNSTGGNIQFDNEFAGNILFNTSNIERLRIDSLGNSTFAGNVLLSGYLSVTSNTIGTGATRWIGSDGTTSTWFYNVPTGGNHYFAVNNSNQLSINENNAFFTGNVGIGTTSPSSYFSPDLVVKAKADLGGITIRSNATSDNNYLMFADGTSGNTKYRGYVNYNHSADSMTFGSAAVARMTIDSSGNVGITASAYLGFNGAGDASHSVGYNAGIDGAMLRGQNGIVFGTGGGATANERMRITSGGTICVGNTGTADRTSLDITAGGATNFVLQARGTGNGADNTTTTNVIRSVTNDENNWAHAQFNASGYKFGYQSSGTDYMTITSAGVIQNNSLTTTQQSAVRFSNDGFAWGMIIEDDQVNNGFILFSAQNGDSVGSITRNGLNTQFNTSSDYRLKEDLQDFNGLDKVSKIPVYDFKWKTDESRSYGVMAHELQEVLPDAVSGDKDAINEDGSIEPQGVDYSKIVPLLVKSIQELKAEVDLLKQECKCKN